MEQIDGLIKAVQYAISAFLGVRAIHCLYKIASSADERAMYIRRLINSVIIAVFAIVADDIKDLMIRYLS